MPRRLGPDLVLLVAGLIALATATSMLTGGAEQMQWTLTGTAVGIGAILLVLSSLWK
jgi:hypothetical protein